MRAATQRRSRGWLAHPRGERARALRLLGIVLLAPGLAAEATHAQASRNDPPEGPALGISATHVAFLSPYGSSDSPSFTGPTVTLTWVPRRALGLDLALTYLPPSGFYDLTGGIADAGVAYGIPVEPGTVLLRAGLSGTLGGNSDGTPLASGGGYVGASALVRVGRRVALRADATVRPFIGEVPTALSAGAGAAILL